MRTNLIFSLATVSTAVALVIADVQPLMSPAAAQPIIIPLGKQQPSSPAPPPSPVPVAPPQAGPTNGSGEPSAPSLQQGLHDPASRSDGDASRDSGSQTSK